MGRKKVLVIAGTHQREIGFSHPTADLIVKERGGSVKEPHDKFFGVDGTRRAEFWDFGNLSVAKIYRTGEPSSGYLRSLPLDELLEMADFRARNLHWDGENYKEWFGGNPHMTSVHELVWSAVKPSFYVDLHSWHVYTKGQTGTGAEIIPYARLGNRKLVSECLANAKRSEPEIYGRPGGKLVNPDDDTMKKMRLAASKKHIRKKDLVKFLSMPQERLDDDGIEFVIGAFRRLDADVENHYNRARGAAWGNNWYIDRYRTPRLHENFCLEGVHWGPENQSATARFLTHYLAPLL